MPKQVIIIAKIPPGDLCALSAAVKSLHQLHPGEFLTGIKCSSPAIFEHNPLISKPAISESTIIQADYMDILNVSNQVPVSFLLGFDQR